MLDNPVFISGQNVRCIGSRGYLFTTGKIYTVLQYECAHHGEHFTWPAFVRVVDDSGTSVSCHAYRFEAIP